MADRVTPESRTAVAAQIIGKYEAPNEAQAIEELLADLRHFCFMRDLDFSELERRGYYAYAKERGLL